MLAPHTPRTASRVRRRCSLFAALAISLAAPQSTAQTGTDEEAVAPQARMPDLPPAVIDESLRIGGEEIDARQLRSRMTVEVMVNDTGPYRFIVDSGADTSVVGERLATDLGLEPGDPVLLNAMTETRVVDQVLVDSLEVGPTRIDQLELPVLKNRNIGAEGMIGLDALVEQRLMLDFEERHITVDDARIPAPRMDGVIVVRGRLQRGQLILTEVRANREKVDAVIDTGSEVTIGNLALRDRLIKRGRTEVQTAQIVGVTGAPIKADFATIGLLKLGPVTLRNVPMAFVDVPPFAVFGMEKEPALLLGTDLMELFRKVSLDFRDRKVRFQVKKCQMRVARVRTISSASRISADRESACED